MTTDITNVQMAYMFTIRLLARAPIMIILSLIMTLTINVTIAVIMLITVPILGGALIFIAKKAHPHFVQVNSSQKQRKSWRGTHRSCSLRYMR